MNQLKRLHRIALDNARLNLGLFIVYIFLISLGSLSPHAGSSMRITYEDKILHIIGYGVFTYLGSRIARSHKQFLIIALSICFYGGLIEVLQSLTGRSMSWLDFIANGIGIAIAFSVMHQQSYSTR